MNSQRGLERTFRVTGRDNLHRLHVDAKRLRHGLGVAEVAHRRRDLRAEHDCHARKSGHELTEKLEEFARERTARRPAGARDVAAWPSVTRDQSKSDGIGYTTEYDRDRVSGMHEGQR